MAITTLDGYIAANKQVMTISRLSSTTNVSAFRQSIYNLLGDPGAGVLAGTNTANGVLITSATPGFPRIDVTTGKYYLSRVNLTNNVSCNIIIQDLILKAGAYSFNSNVVLNAKPDISTRVPNGTDYSGVDMYFECVTAFTGVPVVTVTYTNQDGVAGRSTGAFSLVTAPIVGRLNKLPLQSGDSGVQSVDSVLCTTATVGTFNIQLVRDLYIGRIPLVNGSLAVGLDSLGLPEIFPTSALNLVVQPDGAATGVSVGLLEIASA
jgi:hypothetical protein